MNPFINILNTNTKHTGISELGFQHNILLSLAQLKSKSGSCKFHAIDRTPR